LAGCTQASGPAAGSSEAAVDHKYLGKTLAEWRAQLESDNRVERLYAAVVLGEMGAPAVPVLRRALTDDDAAVRYWAAVGLRKAGQAAEPAVPDLKRVLEDRSYAVRVAAAHALWTLGERELGLDALIRCLDAPQGKARLMAVSALIAVGPDAKKALPRLRRAMKEDPDRYVVRLATTAVEMLEGLKR